MERKKAEKWYRWLWLSPLLTIPTLFSLYYFLYSGRKVDMLICRGRAIPNIPYYSEISALVVDPLTPAILYAGTSDGVFKSTDSGGSWKSSGLPESNVQAVAVDPRTPTIIYAASQWKGVFKSTDGGSSWSDSGLTKYAVSSLAIDTQTPNTLYAGIFHHGVYRSTDGGGSWNSSGLTKYDVYSLAIDPHMTTSLYAGTSDGVFKSTDGGGSWKSSGLPESDVQDLAIDPRTPTIVYAGTREGIFKSTDGGESWNTSGLSYYIVYALAIDPQTPTTLYAGTYSGMVFKSTDGGGNWKNCELPASMLNLIIPVLGSTLWHLVLLIPTLNNQSGFVRWHGRQALLLAGVRTAIAFPMAFMMNKWIEGEENAVIQAIIFIIILIVFWLFGTRWGQGQTRRGDCALMRWTGHAAELPLAAEKKGVSVEPKEEEFLENLTNDELIATWRSSSDPEVQHKALNELKRRGAIEEL